MIQTRPSPDPNRPANCQRGFTLIEVVIALTVFSIGLLAASMMQSASIKGNRSSASVSQSSNWAAGKMEEILSTPYASIVNNTATSPDGMYTMTWTVANNTPVVNTMTVVITVTWNTRGRTLSSQFTEIISQPI